MALAGRETCAPQGHALIQRHVVSDLGRLADHNAHPVVDEEPVADPRRGVNLDAGYGPRDRGNRPRQKRDSAGVQGVGHTVCQQGVNSWPRSDDLCPGDAAGGRIATLGCGDIPADLGDRAGGQTWHR